MYESYALFRLPLYGDCELWDVVRDGPLVTMKVIDKKNRPES